MSTFHGRFLAACNAKGIRDHNDLIDQWKAKYGESLKRQVVHRWFREEARGLDYKYLFKFADMTGYSARWIAVHAGDPQKWQQISPEQAEILAIHKEIQEPRREMWVQTGRDALTAQTAEKPTASSPFPFPKR